MTISEALKNWRNSSKLTRKEISGVLSVHPQQVYDWESAKRPIPVSCLILFLQHYNLSLSVAMDGKVKLESNK